MTSEGMSVTSAPTSTTRLRASAQQSQWALIKREFCKRRLAVAALLILVALVSASVFAPLLANDRPLYYVGINRFEFRETGRSLRGLIGQLANPGPAPSNKAELIRSARLQFKLMSVELDRDSSAQLNEVRDQFEAALKESDRATGAKQLRALTPELRTLVDSLETKLVIRRHWPVFEALTWADLGFMAATVLMLTYPLWRRYVAPQAVEGGFRRIVAVLCLVPALCSLGWWWMVPVRVDRTNYKSALLAAADVDGKAPAVFYSVVWPPIAYGIDEYDLADKSSPPVWYPESWRPHKNVPVNNREDPLPGGEGGSTGRADAAKKEASAWNTPHLLGTDKLGRDVLCRMIWGGRVSLSVGIVAVAIYVAIGIVIGALAGYFRGFWDLVISRIIEVVICFPSFFLILTIVAMVGPGLLNIMIVIGLTGWTGIARLVRGEFLRLVDQEFVLAGKALGYSPTRLIFRHVLPNAMAPVLVSATFGIAGAILTESGLSFLGLGISIPTPSWGSLLADGREALEHAPWLIHFPGLAIFITITAYNLIGEALRDAADPRLRGSR